MDNYQDVPAELRAIPHWVAWKPDRHDPRRKVPMGASGRNTDWSKSSQWLTFEDAVARAEKFSAGIGFVPAGEDIGLVDLDSCVRIDSEGSLEMAPWAQEWVDAFASYTEISPSGTGLRIVARGAKGFGNTGRHIDGLEPMSDQKAPAIEAANKGKFFAITGDWLVGTPETIEDRLDVWKRLKAFLDRTEQPKARDRSGKPTGGGVPSLAPMSARAIDEMPLPEIDFVVPGIVSVGGAMLGARPKEGKTYMMIDWGIAVASGGRALGSIQCEQGDALLLLLEDNAGRFKRRMRQMLGEAPKPDRLAVQFMDGDVRRIDTGLPEQIRRWCRSVDKPRLVVVDTLTAVRPVGLDKRSVFQVEYEMVRTLNDLAHELGVAIVIVHHLRKMKAEGDPVEELSGTHGLAAAVDTVIGLNKNGSGGYELRGRGRDVEEFELGLVRGEGRWTKVGSAEQLRMTGERQRALAALRRAGGWVTAEDVGKETGQKADAARRMLDRMVADGDCVERNHGQYRAMPDQGELPVADDAPSIAEPF